MMQWYRWLFLGISVVAVSGWWAYRNPRTISPKRPKMCIFRSPTSVPATGAEWRCYDQGRWASLGQWSAGQKEGRWQRWYTNGNRAWEGTYIAGKKHGVFATYNVYGLQISLARYQHDQLHGPYLVRADKGKDAPVLVQGRYHRGAKCGPWKYWDTFSRAGLSQHRLKQTIEYKSCEED